MDVSYRLSTRVGEALKAGGLMLCTAESCTGGWVAQVITAVPGSSQWFERGYVTYSNRSKQELLGVREETLRALGAVSEAAVREMAEGALARSQAQVSVAVSGIAGPDGGTPQRPVGTVWIAWAREGQATRVRAGHYVGDREMVRRQSVMAALQGVLEIAR